jgi:hypothetical protein
MLPVTPALAQDPEQEWRDAYTAQYGSDPDSDSLLYPADVAAWRASWLAGYNAGAPWAAAPDCVGFIYVDNIGNFSGQQVLTGWAADLLLESGPSGVNLIEVYFGERFLGSDAGGYPRPDADAYVGRANLMAGFQVPINFDAVPSGQQPISVWGQTACGWVEANVVMAIGMPAPPVVAPPPPPIVAPPPTTSSTLSINDQRQTVARSYSSGYYSGYSGYSGSSYCIARDSVGNCTQYSSTSGYGSTCISRDIYGNCTQYSSTSGYGSGSYCISRDIYGNCTQYDSNYYGNTSASRTEQNFDFTVTLSPSSSQTVTVNYSTADGSAVQNEDYAGTSGTLTFSPGETSKTITVRVYGTSYGGEENFYVNLSNASGATISDNQGVGTIVRDSYSSSGYYGGGGGYYGGYYNQVCIQRDIYGNCTQYSSGSLGQCIQYDTYGNCIQYSGGTGTCIQYDIYGNCIQYSGGTGQCIQYDIYGNCIQYSGGGTQQGYQVIVNATGTVVLSWTATSGATTYQVYTSPGSVCTNLGPHGSPIPASQTTVTIALTGTHCIEVRDQFGTRAYITVGGTGTGGSISIGNTSCNAGSDCVFTVTQSGGTATATVSYQTVNGSAFGLGACPTIPNVNHDFVAASSSVSVPANGTGTITITTCNSGSATAENFTVLLTGTTSGTITGNTGTGTINTSGPVPTATPIATATPTTGSISIGNASCTAPNPCNFTVSQSGGTSATVTYSTLDVVGGATGGASCASAGADYVTVTGGTVPVAGGGSATIPITTCTGTPGEPAEIFNVQLTNTTTGSITNAVGVGTIAATAGGGSITIANNPACAASSVCNFTVTRAGGVGPVDVNYFTQNGSATGTAVSCPTPASASADYVIATGTVTINTSVMIPITICSNPGGGDGANETFTVNLSGATGGATILDDQATGTIP